MDRSAGFTPQGAPKMAYAERRTAEDRSKREILRYLKRFIAGELYLLLQAGTIRPAIGAL
jgi:hypothetical protein